MLVGLLMLAAVSYRRRRGGPPAAARTTDVSGLANTRATASDASADAYDAQHRTHVLRRLRQRAANLGFGLVNLTTGEVAGGTVS